MNHFFELKYKFTILTAIFFSDKNSILTLPFEFKSFFIALLTKAKTLSLLYSKILQLSIS